jgi:hypothetical protein
MPDRTVQQHPSRNNLIIMAAFARLDLSALAIASAVLGGLALLVATAWQLLLHPSTQATMPLHLGLLASYLPGYSVSWFGCVVGFIYGTLIGFCVGAMFGAFWNLIHHVYLLVLTRADLASRVDL